MLLAPIDMLGGAGPAAKVPAELAAELADWPGPRVGLCLPGSGPAGDTPGARDILVIEFVDAPSSHLAAVRAAVLAMDGSLDPQIRTHPLLFLSTPPTDDDLRRIAACRMNPAAFDHRLADPDGDLAFLVLGSAILCHPLFRTFLRTMAPGITVDGYPDSLRLITEHLVPAGAA